MNSGAQRATLSLGSGDLSPAIQQRLIGLDETKVVSIPNAVDPDRLRPTTSRAEFLRRLIDAGLVLQIHGSTIPLGEDVVNLTVREPVGVVGQIAP